MSESMSQEYFTQLKTFIELCKINPSILHKPELSFVKSFIEYFGGTVPNQNTNNTAKDESHKSTLNTEPETELASEPESEESDLELDMTGVIEPDNDLPQKMGDFNMEPSEDDIANSQTKRSEAMSAFIDQDYDKAIQLYTEAIELNPHAALLYAKRGQIYLLLKKPNACIRDCERALEINPDSAAAHKFRGRAYQLLGKWEEAANDLRFACKLDFDEQADEWLREVTPNARRIEEHKRKKERKTQEKLERERQERIKKAREAQQKAQKEAAQSAEANSGGSGPGMSNFYQFMNDPEVLQAFQDPEVAEAFKEISSNPAAIMKYQSNPKIMKLIDKLASKFGGAGGMGGFPGMAGMGNMPGFPGAANFKPSKPSGADDDVGLD